MTRTNQTQPALNTHHQQPWYRQAAAVIPRHVYLKGFGTMLFISLFFGAYFYLLKHQAYPTTVIPLTWLDHRIDFQPLALPLYISLWVYVSLPPLFLATRRAVYGYGLAIAGVCLTALTIFYFWPTTIPTANTEWAQQRGLDFLKSIDAAGNACPSLHVATAIFSGIWLHHLLRRFGAPLGILFTNWVWCIGIVYSTMATRQHVALDVLAGLVLGVPAAYLSLRYRLP